jgi:hypothetical protein
MIEVVGFIRIRSGHRRERLFIGQVPLRIVSFFLLCDPRAGPMATIHRP